MGKNWKYRRDDAGSMLATVIVIVLGAAACAFISAADTSDRGFWTLIIAVTAAIMMVATVIWYRYGNNTGTGLGFWLSLGRNHRDDGLAAQYRPRKVRDGQSEAPTGTNKPITADEAHEIQQTSNNTWVPSKNRDGGKA